MEGAERIVQRSIRLYLDACTSSRSSTYSTSLGSGQLLERNSSEIHSKFVFPEIHLHGTSLNDAATRGTPD